MDKKYISTGPILQRFGSLIQFGKEFNAYEKASKKEERSPC